MTVPPLGICIPVEYVRVRDGDTPVFSTRTGQQIAVRMIGVNAPELHAPGGMEAAAKLHDALCGARDIRVFFPLADAGGDGRLDVFDLLRAMTFDRVPGNVWADGVLIK